MRFTLLCLLPALALAKDIPVPNLEVYADAVKAAQPGDSLVLAEGEWKDAQIRFKGEGTATNPITLKAAIPGKTVFTGNSRLQVGGKYLRVEGLHFRDPAQTTGEVIELRADSKLLAYNCVVVDCAVTQSVPVDLGKKTARFVSLYGTGNTVERCHFAGKTTGGTMLVVWFTPGGVGQHVIKGNYFGPRPNLGRNGGETIRIGDSETHETNAKCEVTGNLFEQCNGEGEIISVKSNENHMAGNTFLECEGALTLRHAHRCVVENNAFIGNHKKMTGGVRIIGEDHLIKGNYAENLEGDDYRSAFSFMKGIPNSPANGYYEVKNVTLAGNTAVDCKVTITIGSGDRKGATLPPVNCTVKDNVFVSAKRPIIVPQAVGAGWTWQNNVMNGKGVGMEGLPGLVANSSPKIIKPTILTRADVGVKWLP